MSPSIYPTLCEECGYLGGHLSECSKLVKPTLVQLRLEQKVAESAAKWWKVEDWLAKHNSEKFEETDDYSSALCDFIVSLMKG